MYNLITPDYAAHWRDIGALLGIKKGILDGIERNFPSNVSWCSNELLEKWLESNKDASWQKLIQAIDKLAVTTSATANLSTAVISPQSLSGNNLVILLYVAVILYQCQINHIYGIFSCTKFDSMYVITMMVKF